METRDVPASLWQRRGQLPSLPLPGAVAAALLLCLIAALASQCSIFGLIPAVLGGAILAALFLLHRSVFAVIVPFCAAGAVLFFARSAVSAAAALFLIPLGGAAAAAVYRGMSRLASSVLCAISAGLWIALPAGIFLLLKETTPLQAVRSLKSELREVLGAMSLPMPGGSELSVFSPEAADALLEALTPLMPGLCGVVLFLLGVAVTSFLRLILVTLEARADFLPDMWYLGANRGSAAVYCGAQLLFLLAITTPDAEPLYYAAYNTALLFMMPLSLAGFGALWRLLRTLRPVGAATKAAFACLILMLLLAGLYWTFTAAAFYGVWLAFRSPKPE